MSYKINIKCELNNISDDKITDIKKELLKLTSLYFKQPEKVAYYYEDINTKSVLSYNSDILFYAASTIKILVCMMLLQMAEEKEIDLDKKLLISMNDIKQDTGVIKYQKEDTYYTIKELIKLSIIESDNTAYIKLVNYIGKENIKKYGIELGAKYTLEGKDLFGLINCEDMAIYWKKIKYFIDHSIYGKELYEWLSNPSFWIVEKENIGNNVYIKKYGSFDVAYHEAGYVDCKNPYYMIILTQKNKSSDKKEFINETAKKLYKIHQLTHKKR